MQRDDKMQRLELTDRRDFSLCPVDGVENFDESSVLLSTSLGFCRVVGSELKITKLDLDAGVVSVTGNVDGIFYDEEEPSSGGGDGFFAKLFK